jgi:hypothetical protein
MSLRANVLTFAFVSVLAAAGIAASAASGPPDPRQKSHPTYSLEGAWYGMTNIAGIPPTPTLDTFVSDAERRGAEGTFLCTIPATIAGQQTPAGHGNWVRVGKNRYAFTAMRAIHVPGSPDFIGWAKFWGTITAVSDSELAGTMNAQFFQADGTPISPQYSGTIERHRVEIAFEQ